MKKQHLVTKNPQQYSNIGRMLKKTMTYNSLSENMDIIVIGNYAPPSFFCECRGTYFLNKISVLHKSKWV